ncbi:MAG: 50S ribosomal protein L4 [Candidatus Portnoybacteria bacterium CG10_big_fil_rev_8_21_14_0_10_44_7]|uniref:Large ribosomal subunit protein uL4 n=1 Tax=Candidatus Portnoybacteria bacterium CG10_big_fil_rev_8_21_14_0_10_44_7 TaxID=1974816 RepID=A0A2M8KIV0_9BACT|nr:MAG: 50S ribosomal protein L4 [Candidatus Portnoybacteria bacterium CG10_big_fil_rev_8_21_14_0_10_44_7]
MAKVKVFNQRGEGVGEVVLPARLFSVAPQNDLIYQALVAAQAASRKNLAHTKDRAAVAGGGKKPWRQKGTGRARHGSIRSPLWVGGGVTFGPTRQRNFSKKINKKMRQKALLMLLSQKHQDRNLTVLDKIELADHKTKEFAAILQMLRQRIFQEKKAQNLLLVLPQKSSDLIRASRNLKKIRVISANNLNMPDLLKAVRLVLLKETIKSINQLYHRV